MLRACYVSALERISLHESSPQKRKKKSNVVNINIARSDRPEVDGPPLKARKVSPHSSPGRARSVQSTRPAEVIVLPKRAHQPPLIIVDKIASDETRQPSRSDKTQQAHLGAEVLGQGVYTGPSTRPGAGLGLFAARDFAANTLITECVGDVIKVPSGAQERKLLWKKIGAYYQSWSHLIEISEHEVLQCVQVPQFGQGGGSFANDSRPEEPNGVFVRVRDEHRGDRVFIKSLQPLKAGMEVTVSYGDGFWRSFQEAFPERYESLFGEQLFQIDHWDQQWQRMLENGRKKDLVTLLNRAKPVPPWPELRCCPKQWNTRLVTYALYKYHRLSAAKLSPSVLALLRPESDHYFTALGKYLASQKRGERSITESWGVLNSCRISCLTVPRNPVFRADISRWCAGHLNAMYRFFHQERYVQLVSGRKTTCALMKLLSVLNHHHPLYEQLVTEYIFRAMNVAPGQVLNSNAPKAKQRLRRLCTNVTLAGLRLPPLVCGQPLGKDSGWRASYVRVLLQRKGVQVIELLGMALMSPFRQLDMLFDCGDEAYREGLLSLCRERKCQFATIVHHARYSKCGGIRCRPIAGVRFDHPCVDRHELYFQYVHYAGIDTQEVYEQSGIQTLSCCIRMIGKRYQGSVSQKEFLAMLLARLVAENEAANLDQAIGRVREYLSDDLRYLTCQALCEQLRPLGETLQQEHRRLPRIAALGTYSQESG